MGGFFGGGGGGSSGPAVAYAFVAWDGANYSFDVSWPKVGAVSVTQLGTGHSQVTITNAGLLKPIVFAQVSSSTSFNSLIRNCNVQVISATVFEVQVFTTDGSTGISGTDLPYNFYCILS